MGDDINNVFIVYRKDILAAALVARITAAAADLLEEPTIGYVYVSSLNADIGNVK